MTESIFGRITRHVRFSSGSEPEDVPRLILGDRLHEEGFERHGPFPTSHASYVPDTHQPPHLEPLHPAQHGTTSLDPIHHALALPEILIVSGLEQAPSPAQIKLISIVSTSCVQLDGQTYVPPQPQGWMTIWIRDAHGPEVPSWVVSSLTSGEKIA